MKIGFTKAYRKELESDIWKMPPLYQRVFFYLRQLAVWQPESFPTKQKYKIALNPGQLITSLSIIADGVSWYEYGVKKTPNKKIIKDILRWLESNSMVTVFSNRFGTFIMLINWYSYNGNDNEEVTQKKQEEVTQKKRNVDTLKEVKEVKEINKKTFMSDSIEIRLAGYLSKHILRNNPKYKKPDLQKWAKTIDLMLRIDKRQIEDIRAVIKWCQVDSFWQNNILSTKKLREKFDQLYIKMQTTKPQEPKKQYVDWD